MGCSTCSSGGCGTAKSGVDTKTAGCGSGGCASGGCNKLNVFDWLGNMELPGQPQRFNIVEVRFKGGRKEFFRNQFELDLTTGDAIVVEGSSGGWHVGFVSLQGELVRLQMKRKNVKESSGEIRNIYRIATKKDLEKLAENAARELPTLFRSRYIIDEFKVNMKLSDVEFQADSTKATFFYSADDRVDFRELIKNLAAEFKVRVEMRQISLRQEAGRLGGIGICGRELCCSTWLTDFKAVNTSAARYQNLSLNPAKLSGQCGRLKCCLNYELETYMDALKGIPTVDRPLITEKGEAHLQKTDIFRRLMWFGYKDDNNWYPLPIERVDAILALNKAGQKAPALTVEEEKAIVDAENAGPKNDDLLRLDEKYADRDKLRKQKQKEKEKQRKAAQANKKTAEGGFGDSAAGKVAVRPIAEANRNRQPENRKPDSEQRNKPENRRPEGEPNRNRPENRRAEGEQNRNKHENRRPEGEPNRNKPENVAAEGDQNQIKAEFKRHRNRPNKPNNPANNLSSSNITENSGGPVASTGNNQRPNTDKPRQGNENKARENREPRENRPGNETKQSGWVPRNAPDQNNRPKQEWKPRQPRNNATGTPNANSRPDDKPKKDVE